MLRFLRHQKRYANIHLQLAKNNFILEADLKTKNSDSTNDKIKFFIDGDLPDNIYNSCIPAHQIIYLLQICLEEINCREAMLLRPDDLNTSIEKKFSHTINLDKNYFPAEKTRSPQEDVFAKNYNTNFMSIEALQIKYGKKAVPFMSSSLDTKYIKAKQILKTNEDLMKNANEAEVASLAFIRAHNLKYLKELTEQNEDNNGYQFLSIPNDRFSSLTKDENENSAMFLSKLISEELSKNLDDDYDQVEQADSSISNQTSWDNINENSTYSWNESTKIDPPTIDFKFQKPEEFDHGFSNSKNRNVQKILKNFEAFGLIKNSKIKYSNEILDFKTNPSLSPLKNYYEESKKFIDFYYRPSVPIIKRVRPKHAHHLRDEAIILYDFEEVDFTSGNRIQGTYDEKAYLENMKESKSYELGRKVLISPFNFKYDFERNILSWDVRYNDFERVCESLNYEILPLEDKFEKIGQAKYVIRTLKVKVAGSESSEKEKYLTAQKLFKVKNLDKLSKVKQIELAKFHQATLAKQFFTQHFLARGEVTQTSDGITTISASHLKHGSENLTRINSVNRSMFMVEEPLDLRPRMRASLKKIFTTCLRQDHPFVSLFLGSQFDFPMGIEEHKKIESNSLAISREQYSNSWLADHDVTYSDPRLDASQKEAVSKSLDNILSPDSTNRKPVTIIHGPPGTGKTSVIAEMVYQLAIKHNLKVLLAAHSNQAVDNLLLKTIENIKKGHDGLSIHDKSKNLRKIYRVHPATAAGKAFNFDVHGETDDTYATRRTSEYNAIFCTLHNSAVELKNGADHMRHGFDVTIIDEAGQNFDTDCLAAMSASGNLILAGDHLQLSPLVSVGLGEGLGTSSADGKFYLKSGLKTIQERAVDIYEAEKNLSQLEVQEVNSNICSQLLNTQYRMNDAIMKWSNKNMYKGRLRSGENNKNWKLSNLPAVRIYDVTSGIEYRPSDSHSYTNAHEAAAIVHYLDTHLLSGEKTGLNIDPSQIGVIVPYAAQRALISTIIRSETIKNKDKIRDVKISSVDGFQGSEMDVILLGLTRSNPFSANPRIGFVDDLKRFNVATTRARKHLCCFANVDTFRESGFSDFFEMFSDNIEKLT